MTDQDRKMLMFAKSILVLLEREEIWDETALFDKIVDNATDLGLATFDETGNFISL